MTAAGCVEEVVMSGESGGGAAVGQMLADQDSNLDKQNQNLLCYRYTIGQ